MDETWDAGSGPWHLADPPCTPSAPPQRPLARAAVPLGTVGTWPRWVPTPQLLLPGFTCGGGSQRRVGSRRDACVAWRLDGVALSAAAALVAAGRGATTRN